MQRALIIVGALLLIAGLLWPWLARLGFGRLPGDIAMGRDGFRLYFPLMSGLIVSVIVTLLLWLFRR